MPSLFPMDAGISQMRGVLKIAKEHGGAIGMAELADEAEEEIDDLFPILDACRLLGLAKVSDGEIRLTENGKKLTQGNMRSVIRGPLSETEPFKTVLFVVKLEKAVTTERLVEALMENSITLYSDRHKSAEALKGLLVRWAVRLKMIVYDQDNDSWSAA